MSEFKDVEHKMHKYRVHANGEADCLTGFGGHYFKLVGTGHWDYRSTIEGQPLYADYSESAKELYAILNEAWQSLQAS